jgi:hypothetical protein
VFVIEPAALKPSMISTQGVKKLGFDPSSKRKQEFNQFLKSLPTPSLGRGAAAGGSGILELTLPFTPE